MSKKCIIAVMYSLLTAASANTQTLTVDSCYAFAVRNYPLIKQYDLIEKSKEYTLSNAGKAYLPQVSITAIEGYVFGGLPSIGPLAGNESNFKFIGIAQLNQTIWDGGATKTQKNIITASSEVDKATIEVSFNDLRTRVNELFFGILLVDEQLKQLEIQDTLLNSNINRIKLLNQNGLAYKTDVDEIRVEQLKLSQQRKELKYVRNGYLTMLSVLIGVKIGDQAILQKPPMINLLTDNQILRPELGLYKRQRDLLNAQAGLRKVNLMPKIGFLGAGVMLAPGIGIGNGSISSLGVAGLSASWNIGGLYKNSNEKELTKLSLNKVNVQEEVFLFNTRFHMTQSSVNIQKQQAILDDDGEIMALRKTIREGYQFKYDSGVGTLHDLLNAITKEGEASAQKALHETQLLKTMYEYKTTGGN